MSRVPVAERDLVAFILSEIDRKLSETDRRRVTVPVPAVRQAANVTTASTSYGELTRAEAGYGHLVGFKALWDAGLRPQFLIVGNLVNDTGGQTTYLSFLLQQYSSGEAEASLLAAADARSISVTGTGALWKQSGWLEPTITAPTEDHALALLEPRVTGGTGTLLGCALFVRWSLPTA